MFKLCFRFVLYLFMVIGFSSARAGAYEDFFKAISFDDERSVSELLKRGFDPNSLDEKGQAPLYLSLRGGSFKVADVLLNHPVTRIDLANSVGETALMMSALKGQTEWLQKLSARGASLEPKSQPAWTALHYAASGPELKAVQWLLAHGSSFDGRQRCSPSFSACSAEGSCCIPGGRASWRVAPKMSPYSNQRFRLSRSARSSLS